MTAIEIFLGLIAACQMFNVIHGIWHVSKQVNHMNQTNKMMDEWKKNQEFFKRLGENQHNLHYRLEKLEAMSSSKPADKIEQERP